MNIGNFIELSEKDLKLLCAHLEVSYELLQGATLTGKSVALYNYCLLSNCMGKAGYWMNSRHKSIPIYFSYAWNTPGNQNLEKEVDRIYSYFHLQNYTVVRDKNNIEYGESIQRFMKELGNASLALVFLSEKYIRSANCLFELYELYRNSGLNEEGFRKRIFPVRVENIDFSIQNIYNHVLAHWENQLIEIEKLRTNSPHVNNRFLNKLESNLQDIRFHLPNILLMMRDINSFELKKSRSEEQLIHLRQVIDERIKSLL